MAKARRFREFLPAILARPPNGEVATVIGGQAINNWCELARKRNPELEHFYPFTSEDLDVVARQRAQTLAIAKATKLKLVEADQGYAGVDRAAFVDAKGHTVIQVLGGMYGVPDRELARDTAEVRIADKSGKVHIARIANRTALIRGKIALALASDGVRTPADKEHDRFHLRLLILCTAVATREIFEAIGKGWTERTIINALKALLKVFLTADAVKLAKIDPTVCWPRAIAPEILKCDKARHPRLFHYVENEVLPWVKATGTPRD